MTIDNQIKDEKLNREAAKISALSSGGIRKDEYLTREDILPSDQQQIIEQAKFTYSPLGKAFEQQIKIIKDQGEKQVEALSNLKPDNEKLTIKKHASNDEDTPYISKQKEIFDKLVDDRIENITKLDNNVKRNDLIYRYKRNTSDLNFNEFDNAIDVINKVRDGKQDLTHVKNNQYYFKGLLADAKKGPKK